MAQMTFVVGESEETTDAFFAFDSFEASCSVHESICDMVLRPANVGTSDCGLCGE